MLFLANKKNNQYRFVLQNRIFGNFKKSLKKYVKYFSKVTVYNHNLIKNEIFHRYVLRVWLKL